MGGGDTRGWDMPKYLMLIVEAEVDWANVTEADFNAVMEEHRSFSRELEELGGKNLGGEALQPVATATFLRGTRSDTEVSDESQLMSEAEVS